MWTTALTDLRTMLFDGTTGSYVYRKMCFGRLDSVNLSFKTFDQRRYTNFTTSVSPLGVYISGRLLTDSQVVVDDPISGEFTLKAGYAPNDGQSVEATYYYQKFTDAELNNFLSYACSAFLQLGADITQVPYNLQQAALNNAASQAMMMLSMRWTQRLSDTYLVEDSPKKEAKSTAKSYSDLAQVFMKTAIQLRNDAYSTRAGQTLQPNFRSNFGRVRAIVPRR